MTTQSTSSRAILYFSERVEDATEAVKGLLGGSGTNAHNKYIDTSDDVVRAQLESDRDEVRIEGLKTVVTLISKGRDASGYFASVVKLSSNANLEIRKLVYIIVRRYARRLPDIALLGINSFQRDLQDRNEVVRAMALRVLTGLRLKLAAGVVELAIGKCVRDSSFYVRKAAALALIKCMNISPDSRETFQRHLLTLLNDRNPAVLAASLLAWSALCPDRFELLHPHYRRICFALGDMDCWGQKHALDVLGHYSKRCLAQPQEGTKIDPDLDLLLVKAEDLLCSSNSAVVSSSARLIYALAPKERLNVIARPLTRLINESSDIAYIALLNCQFIANQSPELFSKLLHRFLPRSSLSESSFVTTVKLQILVDVATNEVGGEMVESELVEQAMNNPSTHVSVCAVSQMGRWAFKIDDDGKARCLKQLLQIVKDKSAKADVVAEALNVVRNLVNVDEKRFAAPVLNRLVPMLFTQSAGTLVSGGGEKDDEDGGKKKKLKLVGKGSIQHPTARAAIFWLLGQYCRTVVEIESSEGKKGTSTIAQTMTLDVLRKAALNFVKEGIEAKYHIITLSTKMVTYFPTIADASPAHIKVLTLLHSYILQLARYDESFDLRDRARFCKALTDRLNVGMKEEKSDKNGAKDDDRTDEQLGGVVLRRNQVIHILFNNNVQPKEEKSRKLNSNEENNVWNTLSIAIGKLQSSTIPFLFSDYFIEPWSDPKSLPPNTVREPPKNDYPITPNTDSKEGNQTSLSSKEASSAENTHIDSTHNSNPSTPLSAPFQQPSNAKSKYKDLDAFLDAESEEDEGGSVESDDDISLEADEEEEEEESDDDEQDEEIEEESEEETDSSEEEEQAKNAEPSIRTPTISVPQEDNAWAS